MGSVIDIQVVVTVDVESLKLQQELLQDALRLEGDDAVLVPLVLAVQDHTVHGLLDLGEKVSLLALITELVHLI